MSEQTDRLKERGFVAAMEQAHDTKRIADALEEIRYLLKGSPCIHGAYLVCPACIRDAIRDGMGR